MQYHPRSNNAQEAQKENLASQSISTDDLYFFFGVVFIISGKGHFVPP
jgi:hypothetical protein